MKNEIAVVSGKGGVGKSTVAVKFSVALAQAGASVGLMDADVYGPNIPIMMGVRRVPKAANKKIVPLEAQRRAPHVHRFSRGHGEAACLARSDVA